MAKCKTKDIERQFVRSLLHQVCPATIYLQSHCFALFQRVCRERGGAQRRSQRDEMVWYPSGAGSGVSCSSSTAEDVTPGEEGQSRSRGRGDFIVAGVIIIVSFPCPHSYCIVSLYSRAICQKLHLYNWLPLIQQDEPCLNLFCVHFT